MHLPVPWGSTVARIRSLGDITRNSRGPLEVAVLFQSASQVPGLEWIIKKQTGVLMSLKHKASSTSNPFSHFGVLSAPTCTQAAARPPGLGSIGAGAGR